MKKTALDPCISLILPMDWQSRTTTPPKNCRTTEYSGWPTENYKL